MTDLYERLHEEFAFNLDVAATSEGDARCVRYFTRDGYFDDTLEENHVTEGVTGLTGSWKGQRVWCRPKGSPAPWVAKAWGSGAELVVMLVPPASPPKVWWQKLVEPRRDGNHDEASLRVLYGWTSFRTRLLPQREGCLLIWNRNRDYDRY